jgi:hypothetical protein
MHETSSAFRPVVSADPPPRRQVVLLGASNVALGWRTIFALIRARAAGPIEIRGAFGHGRSYGVRSRVLGRGLPGITECGLWPSLARSTPCDTAAVVTDLGNDLMYGIDVSQIMRWLNWCVDRLCEQHARTVITRLPVAGVREMSPTRFRMLRSLLFPSSRMSHESAIGLAEELDAAVVELASTMGIEVVEQNPAWYGFDPIHVLKQQRASAWSEILDRIMKSTIGHVAGAPDESSAAAPRCPALWRLAPERRWLFGAEQSREQPVSVLDDGTRIHLF